MATRIGIKELRDNFTKIAREATGPVYVTNQNKIVGTYTPKRQDPDALRRLMETIDKMRAEIKVSGIDVFAVMHELGMTEDGEPIDP
jgi:hypothetical protein